MSVEQMIEVCEALKENTTLVRFDMAGVAAPDKVGKVSYPVAARNWLSQTFLICELNTDYVFHFYVKTDIILCIIWASHVRY